MNKCEIKKTVISILVIPVLLTGVLTAQTPGGSINPPVNSFGMGISLDVNKFKLEDYDYTSFRPLSKLFFAVGKYTDLSLFLGSSDMAIDYPAESYLKRLKSGLDFAVGTSIKTRIPLPFSGSRKWLFGEAGYFRSEYDGDRSSSLSVAQSSIYQKFVMQQYYGMAGIIFQTDNLDYYAGLQGIVYHQEETQTYTKFESDMMYSVIAGIDIKLRNFWVLNMHFRTMNGGTISLGVSQYGFYR